MNELWRTIAEDLRSAGRSADLSQGVALRGVVRRIGDGVAVVAGLEEAQFEELLEFDSGALGLAYDLRENSIGVVLLSGATTVGEGQGVVGLRRLPDTAVGPETLGRVLDPLGNPRDEGPPLHAASRSPLFRPAPEIIDRRSVDQTLWTGVLAIDAAVPIGRGQRELIVGDRNTGKTAVAIDAIAAQRAGDVACVYVAIGQPMSRVQAVKAALEDAGCWSNTAIIAAYSSDSPGLQYLAPLAGATLAESFRDAGGHALVVYDDLTKHADAYRELALLLDRPPGREAYPGDIFYVHAELLERAAAVSEVRGGGSVTALPIIETTDGDISAYIPTNLISITDGQVYLDAGRFERDLRPAVDIGRSVSRIGTVAQPPPMREASKNLKIQYSRFESLEKITRVGLDIDAGARKSLQQGAALRSLLRQRRLSPRSISQQVLQLMLVNHGRLDGLSAADTVLAAQRLQEAASEQLPDAVRRLNRGESPSPADQRRLLDLVSQSGSRIPPPPRSAPT